MKRWLLLVFVLALGLRLFFLMEAAENPFFENRIGDARYYHDWAVKIASGDWVGDRIFWVDPLYAYLLALVYCCAGKLDHRVL